VGLTLIIGGARSGKSAYAQALAEADAARRGGAPVMIATAEALDAEMAERIARHRAERGPEWRTTEAPTDVAAALMELSAQDCAVLDCLTLWLSNLMHREADVAAETEALLAAAASCAAGLVMVANEVGMGIVPENALARRFRDEAGRLNRRIADQAERVVVMFAGQALVLKDAPGTSGGAGR
jgi:adenosylcobinamide kinase/adenosylcobinamide-phosphate guanylyltransferase